MEIVIIDKRCSIVSEELNVNFDITQSKICLENDKVVVRYDDKKIILANDLINFSITGTLNSEVILNMGAVIDNETLKNEIITYINAVNFFFNSVEDPLKDITTDDITEGATNKYFTDQRAKDAIGSTSNVPEGSRLYFTDQRAKDAIGSSTGVIDLTTTPTFTGTTAPSGATTNKICWVKSAGMVRVWGWLKYATGGTGITVVTVPLPSTLPTPLFPSYMDQGNITTGDANVGSTITALNSYGIVCLYRYGVATGHQVTINQASNVCQYVQFSFSYPVTP